MTSPAHHTTTPTGRVPIDGSPPGGRSSRPTTAAGSSRRWIIVVLALTQAATAAVVFGSGASALSSDSSDPTITPAGYAFAIWTVVIVGCVVYSVYAFSRSEAEPYRSIGWPLAATMAGFDLWLLFATKQWVWATVVVFIAMFAALGVAIRAAQHHPPATRTGRTIVSTTLGVYAGWTTVAVWANLAAALHANGSGLPNSDASWQFAVLAGAAVASLIGVWLTRAEVAYLAAVLWALVAVVIATEQRGASELAAAAGVAATLVASTAIVRRLTLRQRRP